MSRIDRELTRIAAHQHGLITFQQALHVGMGRTEVQRRVQSGRWERLARGVFRVAGAPESPRQWVLATCLAAPDGALASHLTAAWLYEWWRSPPVPPHLTVPVGRSTKSTIAHIHRARLGPAEATSLDGIPTTSPARTLVDCAAVLGPKALAQVVGAAFHQQLVTVRSVEVAWDHARLGPGRHGEVRLREALRPWADAIRPGSPAEVRLRQLVVQWGFPEPEVQPLVIDASGEVIARPDLGWSHRKVGLEYDSVAFHGQDRWEDDLDRQAAIEAAGWRLLRADKTDLRPGERALQQALARTWSAAA